MHCVASWDSRISFPFAVLLSVSTSSEKGFIYLCCMAWTLIVRPLSLFFSKGCFLVLFPFQNGIIYNARFDSLQPPMLHFGHRHLLCDTAHDHKLIHITWKCFSNMNSTMVLNCIIHIASTKDDNSSYYFCSLFILSLLFLFLASSAPFVQRPYWLHVHWDMRFTSYCRILNILSKKKRRILTRNP